MPYKRILSSRRELSFAETRSPVGRKNKTIRREAKDVKHTQEKKQLGRGKEFERGVTCSLGKKRKGP